MNQARLALDTPPADDIDRIGFDIGWDHAHHGLVPPPELLHAATPVCQGWMAGRAVFGARVLPGGRSTRQWLQLRLHAWRHGIAFEREQLTAHHLAQLQVTQCPVLRVALGGAPDAAMAPVIERLQPQAGYAAGHLALMSRQAASLMAGVDAAEARRRARLAALTGEPVCGLDEAGWWRVATLRAFATPLPFAQAAALPLAVLPPPRVRLLNGAQGLQALLSLQFTAPGWSERTRAMAALLADPAQRHDFNLLVGALAPRALEAGREPLPLRRALEDAWLHERVQRRWQHFALQLGETGVETLVQQTTARQLAPVRTLSHAAEQATEGWALAQRGRVGAPGVARRLLAPPRPRPPASRAAQSAAS